MTTQPLDNSQGIALITDGSASYKDRSGGWAFVAIDAFDGIFTLADHQDDTTISQMELMAPTQGLEWCAKHLGPCEVLVYSDSEYVVLGATDRTRKRNKNKQYWRALDKAIEFHTYVEFQHVKGHNDHLYNEMADKLAGEARKSGISG